MATQIYLNTGSSLKYNQKANMQTTSSKKVSKENLGDTITLNSKSNNNKNNNINFTGGFKANKVLKKGGELLGVFKKKITSMEDVIPLKEAPATTATNPSYAREILRRAANSSDPDVRRKASFMNENSSEFAFQDLKRAIEDSEKMTSSEKSSQLWNFDSYDDDKSTSFYGKGHHEENEVEINPFNHHDPSIDLDEEIGSSGRVLHFGNKDESLDDIISEGKKLRESKLSDSNLSEEIPLSEKSFDDIDITPDANNSHIDSGDIDDDGDVDIPEIDLDL